ncbi:MULTISPECIES: hypothetical protein [unclassified Pannonibacter]|uniref:hypothetical protein n=1 Tax=unclassified Pannonibacter TaxID=2627228 RepID=UPI0016455191|nr:MULTISPECIES: hypothetical protein [unclassified Pannonibacter]
MTIADAIKASAEVFNVSLRDVIYGAKHPNASSARGCAIFIAHRFSGMSFGDISSAMAYGDHINARHAFESVVRRLAASSDQDETVTTSSNVLTFPSKFDLVLRTLRQRHDIGDLDVGELQENAAALDERTRRMRQRFESNRQRRLRM